MVETDKPSSNNESDSEESTIKEKGQIDSKDLVDPPPTYKSPVWQYFKFHKH